MNNNIAIENMTEPEAKTETVADTESKEAANAEEAIKVEEKNELNDEELLKKVAQRINFFFSDANLRFDRYMKSQMTSNSDKTMSISDFLRFKTVKALTQSTETIVAACEKHASDLCKLNEGKTGIARVNEFSFKFNQEARDKVNAKTVILSELPVKDENGKTRYDTSVSEIKALLEPLGEVTLVRLRHGNPQDRKEGTKGRQPLGSAFVELGSEEILEKIFAEFAEKEDGKKLELKGISLKLQRMTEWLKEKDAEKSKKRQRNEEEKGKEEEEEIEIPEIKIDWKKGCVISFKGLPEGCDREAITEAISEKTTDLSRKPYIDYSRGEPSAALRFDTPEDVISAIASGLKSGDIKICDKQVEDVKVLEGEEEEKYWQGVIDFKTKRATQNAKARAERKKKQKPKHFHKKRRY